MTQEAKKITKGSRPQRAPVGQVGRLSVTDKDPNKVYRFVNDRDNRVEMFQQNGWEISKASEHQIGSRRADTSQTTGSAARVSVGQGDYSVLMEIPKEWYEEDQQVKQQRVNATEQSIKETALSGHKGKFEITRD